MKKAYSKNIKAQRVIVIEDDYTAMSVISDFLKDEGYDVHCFDTPKNLKDIVLPTDTIIVDIRIEPDPSAGIDFIISLRKNIPQFVNSKTIFISNFGRSSIEDKLQLLEPDSFVWLDKPLEMIDLAEAIEKK